MMMFPCIASQMNLLHWVIGMNSFPRIVLSKKPATILKVFVQDKRTEFCLAFVGRRMAEAIKLWTPTSVLLSFNLFNSFL